MDGKYQRIKVLGKGSFGKAYLVRNTELDQTCVVKQMETSTMDPKERNEAVKEALLLKRMDHPNIVRFQEVFMTRKGRLCIVMDYADGGDVHMEIKRQEGRLLLEARILEWFVQTCFALKHVHGRKVLHRDLKTQNIFLMATGQIKLGDFGIARVLDATKDYAKTMVGTPYYLSPEIIEDRPYNFKSDIWSCGVVLYEMTTLKHPFDADSLVTLAGKILRDEYPRPDPIYSSELEALIRSMLCKDACTRPAIDDVLSNPFLQGPMRSANAKYSLGLDLSEFATAATARAAAPSQRADARAQEASGAPKAAAASAPVVGAPAVVATARQGVAPEDADVVETGTVRAPPRPPVVEEEEEQTPSRSSGNGEREGGEDEYEEEFEDYSGSEDGEKAPQSELKQSVAKLKLDSGGGSGRTKAIPASIPESGAEESSALGGTTRTATGGTAGPSSRVGAKAASLRSYLCSQMPISDFERAYALIRGASHEGAPAEQLQEKVGKIIGAEKAPELFSLFQLLCFLEDYASGNGAELA